MGTPTESTPDGGIGTGQTDPGPNPAWNDVLSVIPAELHSQITPHFQKWDQSAQSRIEEANSKFKAYEQFAPLNEHGVTFEQVTDGLRLMQEINTNPRAIYDALVESYPDFAKQVAAATGVDPNAAPVAETNPWEEKYSQLEQQQQIIAQHILQQEEAKRNSLMDAQLDNELNRAAEKFPDVVMNPQTEQFILTQMMVHNQTAEQAFEQFSSFRAAMAPQPFAPTIVGAQGGGYPSQQIDPRKLSESETKNLVVQMLEANKRANQGN